MRGMYSSDGPSDTEDTLAQASPKAVTWSDDSYFGYVLLVKNTRKLLS
jgi:hypothetical protein